MQNLEELFHLKKTTQIHLNLSYVPFFPKEKKNKFYEK